MDNNKKKKTIILISIISIVALLGITYAWFNYYKATKDQKLIAGDIYLTLNNNTNQISLTNMFPMTKEEARSRNDNTITFTLSGKNTSENTVYYEIKLNHGDDKTGYTRFNDSDLVFDLVEVGNNNEETYLVDAKSYSSINDKRIWVDTVNPNTTTEITKTYKLRVWLSEDIIISDTEPTASYPATGTNAFKNHFATVKATVFGDFQEKILPGAYNMLKKNADKTTQINFGNISDDTNGKGLYLLKGTENESCPILFYRGEINNNNVLFGGYCWQMVRTTDTCGIKMIYNGVATGDGKTCENTTHADRIIGSYVYNSNDSFGTFGYMYNRMFGKIYGGNATMAWKNGSVFGSEVEYGDFDSNGTSEYRLKSGTISSNLDATHHYTCNSNNETATCSDIKYYFFNNYANGGEVTFSDGDKVEDAIYKLTGNGTNDIKTRNSDYILNQKDSTVKVEVENWFENNLTNKTDSSKENYQKYLEDTVFCADRSFPSTGDYMLSLTGWNPNGTSLTLEPYFNTYARFKSNGLYSTNDLPNITCPNITDSFSVNNSLAKLNYPVGLLTGDEVIMAGAAGNSSTYNTSMYLYTGSGIFTMTPGGFQGYNGSYVIGYDGRIRSNFVDYNNGVRPVVSLKPGIEFEEDGDGTPTNPYVVKYD